MQRVGPSAVVRFVRRASACDRTALWHFVRSAFALREWEGKSLAAITAVCEAGVADMAEREELDEANVLSYNVAADLAPCWPGDDLPRRAEDYHAGLIAADRCIRWREQLRKGADAMAMAHWVRGIHLMGLGRAADAAAAMTLACRAADTGAADAPAPTTLLLYRGYRALAGITDGETSACRDFETIVAAFEANADDNPVEADGIAFHLGQLAKTKRILVDQA